MKIVFFEYRYVWLQITVDIEVDTAVESQPPWTSRMLSMNETLRRTHFTGSCICECVARIFLCDGFPFIHYYVYYIPLSLLQINFFSTHTKAVAMEMASAEPFSLVAVVYYYFFFHSFCSQAEWVRGWNNIQQSRKITRWNKRDIPKCFTKKKLKRIAKEIWKMARWKFTCDFSFGGVNLTRIVVMCAKYDFDFSFHAPPLPPSISIGIASTLFRITFHVRVDVSRLAYAYRLYWSDYIPIGTGYN